MALTKLEGNGGVPGFGGLGGGSAVLCANAAVGGLGITTSSKPSPDHSKITTKTKNLLF